MKSLKLIICSVVFLLAGVVFTHAADEQAPAASDPLPQQEQGSVVVPVPGALMTPDDSYSYNPLGKPDPFRPFINIDVSSRKKAEEGKKEQKEESIFPLQRAAVEKFRLVGVAGDQFRRVAVVEDAGRRFYPLFVGTRIGLHDGKVTEILPDRVIVDELEDKKTKRIILKLRKNI